MFNIPFLKNGVVKAVAISCLCFLGLFLFAQEQPEPQQMNVLMIAIDDLKTVGSVYADEDGDFLRHVYPDQQLRSEVVFRMTPNLKRLSCKSITFTSAYCASPACNPSRAALMTGIRPHESGMTTNAGAVFFREWEYEGARPLAEATTIPELLKANGWYTASTGKIYHSGSNYAKSDGARSWTQWTNVSGGAGNKVRALYSPESLDWGQEGNDSATYTGLNDYRKADFIAELLENGTATRNGDTFTLPEGQPFFIAAGIFRPHLPFYATKDLIDLFPVEEMTADQNLLNYFIEDGRDLPSEALTLAGVTLDAEGNPIIGSDRFVDILIHGDSIDAETGRFDGWKDMLRHYFASCAIADRAIGRLMEGLKNSPYADNTIVILWSDHNYHLGEKLHETKFTLWDDGARVNFLVHDPRFPENHGARCSKPVGLVDIYPTVAAIAGVEFPSDDRISGFDLNPLLANPHADWSGYALTTFRNVNTHMLRTQRYKLIQYDSNPEQIELYDMVNDPEEYHNLALIPTYSEILESMMTQLNQALGID